MRKDRPGAPRHRRFHYVMPVGTFVRVHRWMGGEWLDFPLPTKTDELASYSQAGLGSPEVTASRAGPTPACVGSLLW